MLYVKLAPIAGEVLFNKLLIFQANLNRTYEVRNVVLIIFSYAFSYIYMMCIYYTNVMYDCIPLYWVNVRNNLPYCFDK